MASPAVQVVPPASLPVGVEELRTFCRIGDASEDTFLLFLAGSAASRLHGYGGQLGRALIHSTWRQAFAGDRPCPSSKVRLKLPDVASAKLITLDADGEGATGRALRVERDAIGWFVPEREIGRGARDRILVEYVAGYGETYESVPDPIREAICLLVQGTYRLASEDANLRNETAEGVSSQGFFGPEIMRNATTAHVKDLLAPYRWRPA